MITANKVFKGNTLIIKIYKGANLEWELAVEKYIKWEPTTYIDSNNNFVWNTHGGHYKTNKATLYIKGYDKFKVKLSIYDREWDGGPMYENTYITAYKLDSTTEIQGELPYDDEAPENYSEDITYNINDSKEHTILFEMCDGGTYTDMEMKVYIYKNL